MKQRRIPTNLIQQNCYLRDSRDALDLKTCSSTSSYLSVDESVDESGLHIKFNEYDYPITPTYVNSFAEGADYRKDPGNAILNGHHSKNLGDITSIQEIMSMDSSAQSELYAQLSAKFAVSAAPSSAAPSSAAASASSDSSEGN